MNREEVIKGLEQFIADFKPFCGNKADWQRVYDALALLKAQEPVECENTNKARIFCCSVCGYKVEDIFIDERRFEYPSTNFCPNCGRAVKWDA